MPAVVSSTDGSWSAGTSEPDGSRRWARLSKKVRKRSRISSDVTRVSLGSNPSARDRAPAHDHVAAQQLRRLARGGAVERLAELELEPAAPVAARHPAGHRARVVAQAHGVDLLA